jgi:hypothetical protein
MQLDHTCEEGVGSRRGIRFAAFGKAIDDSSVGNNVWLDVRIASFVQGMHLGKQFLGFVGSSFAARLGNCVKDNIVAVG